MGTATHVVSRGGKVAAEWVVQAALVQAMPCPRPGPVTGGDHDGAAGSGSAAVGASSTPAGGNTAMDTTCQLSCLEDCELAAIGSSVTEGTAKGGSSAGLLG